MWVLVYINLVNTDPFAHQMGVFANMNDCFKARDVLALKAGGREGNFPVGSQAVCIRQTIGD